MLEEARDDTVPAAVQGGPLGSFLHVLFMHAQGKLWRKSVGAFGDCI